MTGVAGTYPQLDTLIQAYLNQDMDLWADTVEGVIDAYAKDASVEQRAQLLADIERFAADNVDNVEEAFSAAYGFDFEPKLIGKTVPEFFAMIREELAPKAV